MSSSTPSASSLNPRDELFDADVVRTYILHRRNHPAQYVIPTRNSFIFSMTYTSFGVFYHAKWCRFCAWHWYHTGHGSLSVTLLTYRAVFLILVFKIDERLRELVHAVIALLEQVHGHALGRLPTHAGSFASCSMAFSSVSEVNCMPVRDSYNPNLLRCHAGNSLRPESCLLGDLGHLLLAHLIRLGQGLVHSGHNQILEHLGSFGSMTSLSILMLRSSRLPVAVTRTMPPPTPAETSSSPSCCLVSSILRCTFLYFAEHVRPC